MLYDEADAFFEKVYIVQGIDLLENALTEDPDFFMAAYGLATYHMYAEEEVAFRKYAEQAVQSAYRLSRGEKLLKSVLQQLLEDPQADVTTTGIELVKLYPDDPDAYFHLAFFQGIAGDYHGQVETLLKAAAIKEYPATVYNSLGYAYMDLGQFEDAAAAFDKYLELKPEEPNPHDSKGDYYMAIGEYELAHESYMRSVSLDSTWKGSLQKANRAMIQINRKE